MYLPCRTKPKYRVVGRRKMFWCWPNVFQGRGEWEHEYYLIFINILSKIQSNLPLIKFLGLIPSTFLVGGWPTPLKNMKVSWDYYSQYMESHEIHVPNHQPVSPCQPSTINIRQPDQKSFFQPSADGAAVPALFAVLPRLTMWTSNGKIGSISP